MTPLMQSSEWLRDILDVYGPDRYVRTKEGQRLSPEEARKALEQAILKKFEEAQVEARLDELKSILPIIALTDRVTREHTKSRIAELDSLRPQGKDLR